MFKKTGLFLELPNQHKWILTKICVIVPLVQLGIKTIGFKHSFNTLKYFVKEAKTPEANIFTVINRHRNFLYLYTKQFPFLGNCLARSLTLWLLLKNKGIDTELRFGMKKEDQKLLAHAWVEYLGSPLATDEEISENYSFFHESILTKLVK